MLLRESQGVNNKGLSLDENQGRLIRSVGGSVVIINGTIRRSPLPKQSKKKRCYEDSVEYGDPDVVIDGNNFMHDDVMAEIDQSDSKVKCNGIEVQIEDLSDHGVAEDSTVENSNFVVQNDGDAGDEDAGDGPDLDTPPSTPQMLNGHACNGHLPQNGLTCTAVNTTANCLKETLANAENATELSLRDCEIIIHALCDEENKDKNGHIVNRITDSEQTRIPSGPLPFPRRKSGTSPVTSLNNKSTSWLHSTYVNHAFTPDRG